MRRGFLILVLLASLCWQSLAVAGQSLVFAQADQLAHALLHWQDSAHHHHDDGSVHDEDSPEGAIHVAADGALQAQALVSTAAALSLGSLSAAPAEIEARGTPPPLMEGPRRPPRLPA